MRLVAALGVSLGLLLMPTSVSAEMKHPLPNTFISTRDFKTLYATNPPTIYYGTCTGTALYVGAWAFTFGNMCSSSAAFVEWTLPVAAKDVYIQWASEPSGNVNNILEVQLIDTSQTSTYLAYRVTPTASAADITVSKVLNGVPTVIGTETVDVFYGSPYEHALWWEAPDVGPGGMYHAYRARGDYRNTISDDEEDYRVRTWADTYPSITQVNKVRFACIIPSSGTCAPLAVHFDTSHPFIITYDPKGSIKLP